MSANAILEQVSHRPWPLPSGPWAMAQTWHDLLFAHWPVQTRNLRAHVPNRLKLDTFDGQAWLAVVPFRMTGIRLRGTPALPWLSAFAELNVRTYVTCEGKPGVWFFSLDAGNPLAVAIARRWFHLPYFHARMSCVESGPWIEYTSQRTHRAAPEASFSARYRPVEPLVPPVPGTLEYFLTERYCLYTTDGDAHVIRAEIHHPPWPLQRAEAELACNTMACSLEIPVDAQSLLHFSRRQDVLVWPPRRLPAAANGSSTR